jgi:hypothetical protein
MRATGISLMSWETALLFLSNYIKTKENEEDQNWQSAHAADRKKLWSTTSVLLQLSLVA